jgi:hypothetical protein
MVDVLNPLPLLSAVDFFSTVSTSKLSHPVGQQARLGSLELSNWFDTSSITSTGLFRSSIEISLLCALADLARALPMHIRVG